ASILPLDWGPGDALTAGPWWAYEVAHGLAAELAFPDRVLRLRYEDLVADPTAMLNRLCGFTGLAFTPRMLNSDALPKTAFVAGTHGLLGSPITPARTSAWRTSLKPREIELFEYGAGQMLDILGYGRSAPPSSCQPRDSERLVSMLFVPIRKLA